jgi:hypothetical protein
MPSKTRIMIRRSRDFAIQVVGPKNQSVGEIEELVWHAGEYDEDTGFTEVAVSFKIKELPHRMKVYPKDKLNAVIIGKIQGLNNRVHENIQQMEIVVSEEKELARDGKVTMKEVPMPEEFEEHIIYTFKGLMMLDQADEEPQTKNARSFKNRL